MLTPRLSIVIATWNAASTLSTCLNSIAGQNFEDWELLIADGGSDDGTLELIQRYDSHITWWKSGKDTGIYDAWNTALDKARGEYVIFLGADDALFLPTTLADIFAAIGSDEYDLVTGRGRLIDSTGKPYHEFGNPWDYRKLLRRMTICHPGALHRRDLFERFGKFETTYRISADYEFLLRLPENIRCLHLDAVFADISDSGTSRLNRWLMLKERYRAQAACGQIGPTRAKLNFIDKLWRIPVAKMLGIPN